MNKDCADRAEALCHDLRWWANHVAEPGAELTPWEDGLVRLLRKVALAIEAKRKPPVPNYDDVFAEDGEDSLGLIPRDGITPAQTPLNPL